MLPPTMNARGPAGRWHRSRWGPLGAGGAGRACRTDGACGPGRTGGPGRAGGRRPCGPRLAEGAGRAGRANRPRGPRWSGRARRARRVRVHRRHERATMEAWTGYRLAAVGEEAVQLDERARARGGSIEDPHMRPAAGACSGDDIRVPVAVDVCGRDVNPSREVWIEREEAQQLLTGLRVEHAHVRAAAGTRVRDEDGPPVSVAKKGPRQRAEQQKTYQLHRLAPSRSYRVMLSYASPSGRARVPQV